MTILRYAISLIIAVGLGVFIAWVVNKMLGCAGGPSGRDGPKRLAHDQRSRSASKLSFQVQGAPPGFSETGHGGIMGNMGYCRFSNTVTDLEACLEHLFDDDLSKGEEQARTRLIEVCQDIIDQADDLEA